MTAPPPNFAVIGAGAWGTALAQVLAEKWCVTLYARAPELAEALNTRNQNDIYLPGLTLNKSIRATADLAGAASNAQFVLLATPAQHIRDTLVALKPYLQPRTLLVNCAKGIEVATGKLLSAVAAEVVPEHHYAVLSGPTFAHEVARGLPAAATFAFGERSEDAKTLPGFFANKTFRPYLSHDVAGVEISGAVKNVIAIACGIVEGKGFGQNARAAVMTRGIAEIKRLGLRHGAESETFLGLSCIGDLTLTCNSMASRNFSLGVMLGQGRELADILAERKTVAEGVTTAKAIALNAHKLNVEMPISSAINKILHHGASIDTVVEELLSRNLKQETL